MVGIKISIEEKKIMAENIKRLMELNGKTSYNVCNDLGLPNSTLAKWTNAIAYPKEEKIEMLANYFGVTKTDLTERKANA